MLPSKPRNPISSRPKTFLPLSRLLDLRSLVFQPLSKRLLDKSSQYTQKPLLMHKIEEREIDAEHGAESSADSDAIILSTPNTVTAYGHRSSPAVHKLVRTPVRRVARCPCGVAAPRYRDSRAVIPLQRSIPSRSRRQAFLESTTSVRRRPGTRWQTHNSLLLRTRRCLTPKT